MFDHHKTPYHRPKGSGETTPKQRLAVDLLISGKARNKSDALRKAGYSRGSVSSKSKLFKSVGVLKYLARLDKKSQKKFGRSIQDYVMGTYFSALKATKLYGKNAIKHPDFRTRIESADRFARLFGWEKQGVEDTSKKFNQFNFFNVDPEKQRLFHENLKTFIRKSNLG